MGVKTTNSFVGRSDRIARALFGNAQENKSFRRVLELAGKMIENPLLAAILTLEASKKDSNNKADGKDGKDAFAGILEKLAKKLRKDD